MNLKNFKVATRLWSGVVIIVLSLVTIVSMTFYNSIKITNESNVLLSTVTEKVYLSSKWAGLAETNVTRMQASVIASNVELDKLYEEKIPQAIAKISEIQKRITQLPVNPEEKVILDSIAEKRVAVLNSITSIRKADSEGFRDQSIKELYTVFNPSIEPYLSALNSYTQLQQKLLNETHKLIETKRKHNIINSVIQLSIMLLIISYSAYLMIRDIKKPLEDTVKFAESIANGNLTAELKNDRKDEFGDMVGALNSMRENLLIVVKDVRSSTDTITISSKEIAQGNQDLSTRSEQAASRLQETSQRVGDMATSIQEFAQSAIKANELSVNAEASASAGGAVMTDVVSTMQSITEASRRISDIISVIDSIAFQTNILALNAAVEAARAGEQGRGFAVVATEVRTLAGRSAEAAKEIKVLINNSTEKVEVGSSLVQKAGASMQVIVENVTKVRDIISEISLTAREQSQSINQINQAVTQLDNMTQANTALVEESAAVAASMSDQAIQLSKVVEHFQISNQGHLNANGTKSVEFY